jgi:hypothetical protein
VKAEEKIGEEKESPGEGHSPTDLAGSLGHGAERLAEIFDSLSLRESADDGAEDY